MSWFSACICMFGLGRGPVKCTHFPSLTQEMGKTQEVTAEEGGMAGKARRESSEVLNPALVRAWSLSELCDVFPSVFVTRADEWPCSDAVWGWTLLFFPLVSLSS